LLYVCRAWSTTAGVAWWWARRSVIVRGVDGFGRFVPLGFLSVDVDVEPIRCESVKLLSQGKDTGEVGR
jgi:hypothetical protein